MTSYPIPLGIDYTTESNKVMCLLELEQRKLFCIFDAISLQCLWLVVKETICSQSRNKIHNEVAYRPVARMYYLCRILQQIIDGFDNVSCFLFQLAYNSEILSKFALSISKTIKTNQ